MDLLFSYQQEKNDKLRNSNVCNLLLKNEDEFLIFEAYYDFEYTRFDVPKKISYVHYFKLNLNNGDIVVSYEIKNSNLDSEGRLFKNSKETKKNNFKLLYDLTDNGVYRGEKRNAYWGVKFYQSLNFY